MSSNETLSSFSSPDGGRNPAQTNADLQSNFPLLRSVPGDLEPIRQHWEQRGRKYGLSPSASWVDETMLHREGVILASFLRDDERVLDAGCANGYTTLQLARKKALRITGVDYAPSMIEHANLNLNRAGPLRGSAVFRVGNFLSLDFPTNSFDKVITKRCLINMGSATHQKTALLEAYRVLKPGGLFLISEVSVQSSNKLNRLRKQMGLETMTPLWHNHYVDEDDLLSFAAPYFEVKKIKRFSSTYYVMTWVMHPIFIRSGRRNYRSWFHRLSANLPQFGDYGLQKLYVLQKRG